MNKNIRFTQRFENYKNSLSVLEKSILIKKPSEIEKAGIVQLFEVTFELAWKLFKDYLKINGIVINSPREAIKHAAQEGLIENGRLYLKMLDERNSSAHLYDEAMITKLQEKVKEQFVPALLLLKTKCEQLLQK